MTPEYVMEVRCLVGCFNSNGDGTLVPVKVRCSFDSFSGGLHFIVARDWALSNGYEGLGDNDQIFVVDEHEDVPSNVWDCYDWNDCPISHTSKLKEF